MARLRWGIMGTGGIAGRMAGTLAELGMPITAVGSAREGAAARFAAERGIPHPVSSHRAVAERDDVDVVYVATTNDRHLQNVLDCVALGKPTLVEKPVGLSAGEAAEMFAAARAAGVFVMEAMWMRFQPYLAKVDDLIEAGAIGEVRHVGANFSVNVSMDPSRRWVSSELGGGSMLDLGVYLLTLVHHVLGPPVGFEAQAAAGPTGVDVAASVISRHAGGATAAVTSSFVFDMANEAVISGTEGRLRIHAPFHHSKLVTLERRGEVVESHDAGYEGHGFRFEVAEVERCLAEGLIESPLRPHADTLAVLEWIDAILDQSGIRPGPARQ